MPSRGFALTVLAALLCGTSPVDAFESGDINADAMAYWEDDDEPFDPDFDEDFSEGTKKERMKACWHHTMGFLSNNKEKADGMAVTMMAPGSLSKSQAINMIVMSWMYSCYVEIDVELVADTIEGGLGSEQAALEDDAARALFGKANLVDMATEAQQELVGSVLTQALKDQKAKNKALIDREMDLKAKEAMLERKLAQIQQDLPTVEISMTLETPEKYQDWQTSLKAELSAMGLELDKLPEPIFTTKNVRGEAQEGPMQPGDWPVTLAFEFVVTEEQQEQAILLRDRKTAATAKADAGKADPKAAAGKTGPLPAGGMADTLGMFAIGGLGLGLAGLLAGACFRSGGLSRGSRLGNGSANKKNQNAAKAAKKSLSSHRKTT